MQNWVKIILRDVLLCREVVMGCSENEGSVCGLRTAGCGVIKKN